MSVVKKKKHVSKKNKKAWRKYCDISDVDAYLEDQRLEERLGNFETKPDSELFVLDTKGDIETEKEVKPLSAKLRKRARLTETPKCFEILLPTSKVEDPNKKRNQVKPVGSQPTALSKITEKRRFQKGVFLKKIESARKNRQIAQEKKRKVKETTQNFQLDLWGKDLPEVKGVPETLCDEFISPEAQLHNVPPTRRLRPKPPLPATIVKRPAVEAPHPGISYNPSFNEHQELLKNVVEHEQKMMKREAHLHRVTTGMFSRVTQAQKESQWREEMSSGLPQPHNPTTAAAEQTDSEEENNKNNEYTAINPPVKNKKKDHKARRKQRERLLEKERLKREKINKKKITDLYKLRKIESSISKNEEKQEEIRSKRKKKKKVKAETAVPALNAHKVPQKEPDLVAPEDLTGDLRHVSARRNLLREQYEALQRRGALAGSKPMMKKARRLKSYFKPGHKVTDQDVDKAVQRFSLRIRNHP